MKTKEIGSFKAKTHFAELIEKARLGQTFVVTRRGVPIAQINPLSQPTAHPRFGSGADEVVLAKDFDEPLPEMKEYM